MKFRNLLIVSALFLSASVAFAKPHTIDTNTYNIDDFSWTNDTGSQNIAVTLKYDGQTDYKYIAYDTSKYTSGWSASTALDTESGKSVWLLKEGVNNITLPENVTTLGIYNTTHTVYSTNNPDEKWMFYRTIAGGTSPSDMVSFGKLDDKGSGNHAADFSFGAGSGETFGTPLPTPVTTLLIALGLGGAFMMYRNRKQQAEA